LSQLSSQLIQITIIICTRNRASMLRRALQSLVECSKPSDPDSWEVLVVDNASSDDTPSLVAEFCATLPLRSVSEEKLGLSNARNRGVREARGTWILWIDDDVTVCPDWLRAYADAIARYQDATALGGPVIIQFEGNPPAWLSQGVEWVQDAYAGRSPKFQGEFHASGPKPYGANFGLRSMAAQTIPFDTNLGHHPSRPTMGGEETEVIRKVLSGGKGWWVPQAFVVHHIDESRQTTDYLWAYYMDVGLLMSQTWKDLLYWNRLSNLAGVVMQVCINHARYITLCLVQDERYRARALRNAAWHWGYIKGCVRTLTGVQKEVVLV
jgi:glucosyl-dolichyl phosphate glucuronosyltransferase